MVRKLNESYSDIWSDNAWDAYDIALEYLGAEGLCEALARAMGTDALADNLKYIFRTNEIPFEEDDEDEEDFDESCGRKSKKRKGKKSVKESYGDFKYYAESFYGTDFRGLEDVYETDDFSDLETWIWEKINDGGCIEVTNSESGNGARMCIDRDTSYDDYPTPDDFIIWSDKYGDDRDANAQAGLYNVLE